MLVKLAKRLYFKPRRCPDCGKICLFCKHHLSERCKDCHEQRWKKIHRKNHKLARKKRGIQIGDNARKRRINQVGYCQLCGCTENLTYHHVGGVLNIIRYYAKIAMKIMRHLIISAKAERTKNGDL